MSSSSSTESLLGQLQGECKVQPLFEFSKSSVSLLKAAELHVYNPSMSYYSTIPLSDHLLEHGANITVYENFLIVVGIGKIDGKSLAVLVEADEGVHKLIPPTFHHNHHSMAIINNKIYVVSGELTKKVERLSLFRVPIETLKASRWHKSQQPYARRFHCASAVHKTALFLVGGMSGSKATPRNGVDRFIEDIGWTKLTSKIRE